MKENNHAFIFQQVKLYFCKFLFYLWFLRENAWYKIEFVKARAICIWFTICVRAFRVISRITWTRGASLLFLSSSKNNRVVGESLAHGLENTGAPRHRFRFAKRHTRDGYRQTSLVPKSSPVSTYSFLTVDCAMQEQFRGNRDASFGNGFNWSLKYSGPVVQSCCVVKDISWNIKDNSFNHNLPIASICIWFYLKKEILLTHVRERWIKGTSRVVHLLEQNECVDEGKVTGWLF